MRLTTVFLGTTLLIAPSVLLAQLSSTSSSLFAADSSADGGFTRATPPIQNPRLTSGAFSRFAIGGSVSPLGPGLQVTTLVSSHLNLRASGNYFRYYTNFATNGFSTNARLNLASAGLAADIYPFRAGFRISPGVQFYNGNKISGTSAVGGGTGFQLNGDTFYSANVNSATGATPTNGTAVLGLNSNRPAFTLTAGWGNTIPRKGGHWSFPFEAGVALTGAPSLNANLTGWACSDQAQTQCANVTSLTDPLALQIQDDLVAQEAKWKNDLDPLKTFPIVSVGVDYSFGVRNRVR